MIDFEKLKNLDWNKYRIVGNYHFESNGYYDCWFNNAEIVVRLEKEKSFNDALKNAFTIDEDKKREFWFKVFLKQSQGMDKILLKNDLSDMVCIKIDSIIDVSLVIQEKLEDGYETLEESMDEESFKIMTMFERKGWFIGELNE